MRKILLFFALLFSVLLNAQKIQKNNTYGLAFNRTGADTLFYLPNDTFSVPSAYSSYKWITMKGTTLYYWNGTKWVSYASGGSSYTFTTPLIESGGTVSLNGLSGYGSNGQLIRTTGSALEYFTPSYITSSYYTFTNGLTESSGTVKLGGELSEYTSITGNGYNLDITDVNFSLSNVGLDAEPQPILLYSRRINSGNPSDFHISQILFSKDSIYFGQSVGGYYFDALAERQLLQDPDDFTPVIYSPGSNVIRKMTLGSPGQILAVESGGATTEWVDQTSYTFTTPLVESGGTVSINGLSGYGSNGQLVRTTGSAWEYFTPSYITSSYYTFTNGLTESSGTVSFGGNLNTGTTTLTFPSSGFLVFNVNATSSYFDVRNNGGSAMTVAGGASGYINLYNQNQKSQIRLSNSEFRLTANKVINDGYNKSEISLDSVSINIRPLLGSLYIDTLTNNTSQNTLLGWIHAGSGGGSTVGYITIGSGLSLSSGTLSATGGGSGITIGTTTITSGTNTKVLYNNSGVVGEYTISGTGNVAMTTSPTFTTPNIGAASGTSVTLSSLTSGRIALVGTSGLITDNSAFLFNTANSELTSGFFHATANIGSVTTKGMFVYFNSTNNTGYLDARNAPSYAAYDINVYANNFKINAGSGGANTANFYNGMAMIGAVTTPTAVLHVAASSTTRASIRMPDGSAPTSPNEGDLWNLTGSYVWQYYSNGSTRTIVNTDQAQTQTNKRIIPRSSVTTSASSLTPDFTTYNLYGYTALAANLTINAPSTSLTEGEWFEIYIKDNGTSRTLTWNAAYVPIGVTLPASTTAGKYVFISGTMNNSVLMIRSVQEQL